MPLYFITGNKSKVVELQKIIPEVQQIEIDLPEIQEIDPQKIIEAKLKEAQNHQHGSFIVEDTSLYLDALGGLPGPLIKWFLKTLGNEGLVTIVENLGNAKATAKTLIGYANEDTIQYFEGVVEGTIVAPKGENGFGWDPIFLPNGSPKTLAEMTLEEKNEISTRRIAAEKLQEYLNSIK